MVNSANTECLLCGALARGHFVREAAHPHSIPLSPQLLERFLRKAHSISMIRLSRICEQVIEQVIRQYPGE